MSEKKIAVAYVRVSSAGQVDNTSIDDQIGKIEEWATKENYDVVVFEEAGESGGGIEKRDKYKEMLDYMADKKNKVSTCVVYKSDRIHRNLKNLLIFIEDFLEPKRIKFLSLTEQFDTSSMQGKLFFQMVGAFAEYEKNQIGARTRGGKVSKLNASKYSGGMLPYGYSSIDGDICIDQAEMKTVKKIFSLYSQGYTYRKIAKYLDDQGYLTRKQIKFNEMSDKDLQKEIQKRKSKGKELKFPKGWHDNAIRQILNNYLYVDGISTYVDKKVFYDSNGNRLSDDEIEALRKKDPTITEEGKVHKLEKIFEPFISPYLWKKKMKRDEELEELNYMKRGHKRVVAYMNDLGKRPKETYTKKEQRIVIDLLCETNKYTITKVFEDNGNTDTTDRPGYQSMLSFISNKNNNIKKVIVFHHEYLFENELNLLHLYDEILPEYNVDLITINSENDEDFIQAVEYARKKVGSIAKTEKEEHEQETTKSMEHLKSLVSPKRKQ